jgi:hypothetical protein
MMTARWVMLLDPGIRTAVSMADLALISFIVLS